MGNMMTKQAKVQKKQMQRQIKGNMMMNRWNIKNTKKIANKIFNGTL